MSAARAPIAANTGNNTVMTTPMVSGNSMTTRPLLSLIISLRMLPSLTRSFTFPRSSSPFTLNVSSKVFPVFRDFVDLAF